MNFQHHRILPPAIIMLLCFLLYANTLQYDYTLDDLMVIKQNNFTTQGFKGIPDIFAYDSFTGFFGKEKKLVAGGRYRPLSIASFAIEYQLTGKLNPSLSHFINIVLYGLTAILIYLILLKILPPKNKNEWFLNVPFFVTLLFIAHPVHTEVVANIKGRDELLAFLFSLLALKVAFSYIETKKAGKLIWISICLFLGLLSKENAIAFVVIIPLMVFYFSDVTKITLIKISGSLLLTAVLFVFIRFLVLGYLNSGELPREILNNPFLDATIDQKAGTILYTLGKYLLLLLFPVTLTHDYYPYHIPLTPLTSFPAIIALVVYLFLIATPFILKKEKVIPMAIALYLFPLFIVSNIIFPVGTFMNERFIYFSSFGFILGAIYIIWYKIPVRIENKKVYYKVSVLFILLVLVLFSGRTITRNVVWKNNFTLFTSDVRVSENSIKCNIAAGGEWMNEADKQKDSLKRAQYYDLSLAYLQKAVGIYSKATNGLVLYGNALAKYKKDYKAAIAKYMQVLSYDPYEPNAFKNVLVVLNSLEDKKESAYKISVYKELMTINPNQAEVSYSVGKLYGQFLGNLDSSRYYLEKAYYLDSENSVICRDLGVVYGFLKDYQKSLTFLNKAHQLAPGDPSITANLGLTQKLLMQSKLKSKGKSN